LPLKPVYTGRFKKDVKLMRKRGKDTAKLKAVMRLLADRKPLEPRYRDHPLAGDWRGHRDCHIEPDWVLIYTLLPAENKIRFDRTGSHADLFR
jgi:mRNA interferase YafQ